MQNVVDCDKMISWQSNEINHILNQDNVQAKWSPHRKCWKEAWKYCFFWPILPNKVHLRGHFFELISKHFVTKDHNRKHNMWPSIKDQSSHSTYFCCHTAACEKRSSMASKLIETLFIYSLASFYGLLASFAVLWQIIRRFEIPSRAKRRDTRKWINPILLSLILSEIVLRLIHSLLIGICQLESYYPSVIYTQYIFKCIWNVVNNGYSFPFPSHLSTGAIPVIVAFFPWIISCYFDWVKRNIRLNLIEGTKTACNNLITCSCYIYLCYYFREMSVDSHANLVRSKEPIIDQGYAITACCSL